MGDIESRGDWVRRRQSEARARAEEISARLDRIAGVLARLRSGSPVTDADVSAARADAERSALAAAAAVARMAELVEARAGVDGEVKAGIASTYVSPYGGEWHGVWADDERSVEVAGGLEEVFVWALSKPALWRGMTDGTAEFTMFDDGSLEPIDGPTPSSPSSPSSSWARSLADPTPVNVAERREPSV